MIRLDMIGLEMRTLERERLGSTNHRKDGGISA